MQFFIVFIVSAVMLGAGAMLSPLWLTRQPRIGTSAIFSLALVVGGAVFWAFLFGWDTLVIDYLLFALVSVIVLGGTFAQGQERAEARGEELLDEDQGWTGPGDLLFFALVGAVCLLPLFFVMLPQGDTAASNAVITLAARSGGTFDSLAPYAPDVSIITAPGFHAITAYLSQQLRQVVPLVHLAMGTVCIFLIVWGAYDLGSELHDKRLGRAMALAAMLSTWAAVWWWRGEFPLLLAFACGLAYLLFLVRYPTSGSYYDLIGGGLMLGAAFYIDAAVFGVLLVGHALFALVYSFPSPAAISRGRLLGGLWLGIPLVAAAGTAPWWVSEFSSVVRLLGAAAFGASIADLFTVEPGWFFLPLMLAGIAGVFHDKRRLVWLVGWLLLGILLPVDYAITAGYTAILLGGYGIFWLYTRLPAAMRQQGWRYRYVLLMSSGLVALGILAGWLETTDDTALMPVPPADRAVLEWVRLNTAEDARLFVPASYDWALPLAERPTSYFPLMLRPELVSVGDDPRIYDLVIWQRPADRQRLLANYDYVIAPVGYNLPPVDFLEPVYTDDSATVYTIRSD